MMKRQNKSSILLIAIIIILVILLIQKKKSEENGYQDDLIFFKLFSSGKKEQENIIANDVNETKTQTYKQYIFDVSYKNIDFKEIQLADTIQKDTLVREKIAPRHKGSV